MKHHLLWHQNVELERTNTLEERLKEKLAWKAFFPFFFSICHCCSEAEKLSQSQTDIKEFITPACDVHYH